MTSYLSPANSPIEDALNCILAESALSIDWQPRAPFDYRDEIQDTLSEYGPKMECEWPKQPGCGSSHQLEQYLKLLRPTATYGELMLEHKHGLAVQVKSCFIRGEYQKCVELLSQVPLGMLTIEEVLQQQNDYSRILLAQTLAVHILSFELTNTRLSGEIYELFVNLLKRGFLGPIIVYDSHWLGLVEEALYRALFYFLGLKQWDTARLTCQLFLQITRYNTRQPLLTISVLKQYT